MPMDEHRAANRANWDDRVPIHRASQEYGADEFIADPSKISNVVAFDREYLGDVTGKSLLHLLQIASRLRIVGAAGKGPVA